ncbi:MAG: hypothetical protein ABH807_03075 [Candidatus Shapirobacteria bacterium]
MSSDLKVGLLSTIYATWLHNHFVLASTAVILFAAFLLLRQPRRRYVFFLFGFLFLLLQFEYQKHFGKALEEQTINSVILQGGHLRTKSIIEDVFSKLIPFGFWLVGWGMVALAMIL